MRPHRNQEDNKKPHASLTAATSTTTGRAPSPHRATRPSFRPVPLVEAVAVGSSASLSALPVAHAVLDSAAPRQTCKFFAKGECRNGTNCPYVHNRSIGLRAETVDGTQSVKGSKSLNNAKYATQPRAVTPPPASASAKTCGIPASPPNVAVSAPTAPPAPPILPSSNMEAKREAMLAKALEFRGNAKTSVEKASVSLDLLLIMDCTGSMLAWIDSAKNNLYNIVNSTKRSHPNLKLRVGFIGYRDFCDGDKHIVTVPFTEDANSVTGVIRRQEATGGGDGPEDVDGALSTALSSFDWRGSAKQLVLVCDAPCHGTNYHVKCTGLRDEEGRCMCDSTISKSHMHRDPLHPEKVVAKIATAGIDMQIIEVQTQSQSQEPDTRQMVKRFRLAYERAPLPADGIRRTFSTEGGTAAAQLSRIVVDSASRSIESSRMRSTTSVISQKKPAVMRPSLASVAEEPEDAEDDTPHRPRCRKLSDGDWRVLEASPSERAVRHTFTMPSFAAGNTINWSNGDIYTKLKHVVQETSIHVLSMPFSAGAMRTAHALIDDRFPGRRLVGKVYYRGAAARTSPAPPTGPGTVPLPAPIVMGPASKPRGAGSALGPSSRPNGRATPTTSATSERELMLAADIKMQTVCKYLAQCFSLSSPHLTKTVDFVTTSYYELLDRPVDDPFRFVAAEPILVGAFVKYSNNYGWTNQGDPSSQPAPRQHLRHPRPQPAKPLAATDRDVLVDVATAFSHFTWEYTQGQIMVTDLQGVNGILTDPQIHTKPGPGRAHLGKRQSGDLDEEGMIAFFATHRCNRYCACLALPCMQLDDGTSASKPPARPATEAAAPMAGVAAAVATEVDLSCLLCGNVFPCRLSTYRETVLAENQEVYCPSCVESMQHRDTVACDSCPKTFPVSPYWYMTKGMEIPKSCTKCRQNHRRTADDAH